MKSKSYSLFVPVMVGWLFGFYWQDIKSAIDPDWMIYVFWIVAYIVVLEAFNWYYKNKAI